MTERLALRRLTADDVDELVALDGDPRVMRFLGRAPRSRAQIEAEVLPRFLGYYSRYRDFGFWAAHERRGGRFLGWLGLRPVLPATTAMVHWPDASPGPVTVAELGYRLRASAWGQGYAAEGARALVRRAFTHPALSRIVATTMAVSTGSQRVLEKAGLRYLRTVHLDWADPLPGNEHGDAGYQLSREDWLRPKPRHQHDRPVHAHSRDVAGWTPNGLRPGPARPAPATAPPTRPDAPCLHATGRLGRTPTTDARARPAPGAAAEATQGWPGHRRDRRWRSPTLPRRRDRLHRQDHSEQLPGRFLFSASADGRD